MLVLANDDGGLFSKLQECWLRYMDSSPQIDCYFLKADPTMEEPSRLDGHTLYIKYIEGYDTNDSLYVKTLKAFKHFMPVIDTYDFVFRTNLSSHVRFNKYLEFCAGLPRNNLCAAIIYANHGYVYPSGAGFTLSIDLVRRLLEDPPVHYIMDDVTIGIALTKWKIPIRAVPRVDFGAPYSIDTILTTISRASMSAFHFRVKTPEGNRLEDDIRTHGVLYKLHYYPLSIPIFLPNV
jgi:hypothetical protein